MTPCRLKLSVTGMLLDPDLHHDHTAPGEYPKCALKRPRERGVRLVTDDRRLCWIRTRPLRKSRSARKAQGATKSEILRAERSPTISVNRSRYV